METPDALLRIAGESCSPDLDVAASQLLYDHFAEEMGRTQHGERFGTRPFDLSPIDENRPSPLNAACPYVVTHQDIDPERRLWVAQTTLSLVMPEEDGKALVDAIEAVYFDDPVQSHIARGGSVLWATGHFSYADQIAAISAETIARQRNGDEQPNLTQDVFISRIVGMFQHELVANLFKPEGTEKNDGVILENIILVMANALQTLPSTESGRVRFTKASKENKRVRTLANEAAKRAYDALISHGGRSIHMAGPGTEVKLDDRSGHLVEGTVQKPTADMMTEPNAEGADRLLTIPMTLLPDPFSQATEEIPVVPQRTPFATMKPRILKNSHDVHEMMLQITDTANRIKPSGVPVIVYDPKGFNAMYPTLRPQTTHVHTV